jgi:hypothetical protein
VFGNLAQYWPAQPLAPHRADYYKIAKLTMRYLRDDLDWVPGLRQDSCFCSGAINIVFE